jgi:membrane protein involved in colicin uptake
MVLKTASPEQKAKAAAEMRAWRAANPEKWKAIAAPARAKWKAENRDEHRECQRNHRRAVRAEILDLLGSLKCAHCGYADDWRALQVDHINGGGRKDSRTSGGNSNLWSLRNWIKANPEEAREKYQVLCANCNWIKRHENGEQPGGRIAKVA